jgi:hypothetical protein
MSAFNKLLACPGVTRCYIRKAGSLGQAFSKSRIQESGKTALSPIPGQSRALNPKSGRKGRIQESGFRSQAKAAWTCLNPESCVFALDIRIIT